MTVRAVEWKKLWEWGTAITVDNENKIISLNLRDENNLIIYDEWDDEIYVDLQLPDWIRPTDAFPVWITTGRVLVADDWDVTWTLICAKTTSGDNIKVLYGDDNKLYVDNWTWIFKQVYLKPEVDALLATYATIAYVDAHDTVVSATAPEEPTEWMLWYNTTTWKLKVYNWTDWDDVWGWWGSGDVVWPNSATDGHLAVFDWATWKLIKDWWAVPTWTEIVYATQAEYTALLPWAASDGKHYFIYQTDSGWQPWVNTVFYAPFDVDLKDEVNWTSPTVTGTANVVNGVAELQWAWLVYPTITSPNSNRTICFWCNMTQPATYNGRFTTWNWWTTDMYRRDSSYVWMYWNQEQPDQWTAELNTWIMWTYTQNWNSWTLYKNGIAKAYNVYPPTSSAEVHIWNPYTDDGFYGYMSKFIVEDKTWTAQEILYYYNQTSWDYN